MQWRTKLQSVKHRIFSPTIAGFGLLPVVLWAKKHQNLLIDKVFVSGIKLVHFAKFVNVFGKLDVFLISDNAQINPEYDN